MDDKTKELKEKLEKDYKDQANGFSNWVLTVLTAVFIFLIGIKKERDVSMARDFLNQHWHCYLILFFLCVSAIFLFKLFGVYASKRRLDQLGSDPFESCVEWMRKTLFLTFLIIGVLQFVFLRYLLWVY